MLRPSLRQLEYLLSLEEHRSFSLAADKCLVTQSTLSAGIKELENILGQKVVQRGRRGTALTPFGQHVCDQSRKIFFEVDRILEKSKSLDEPLSGPLRLGVIPTIAPYLLPSLIPQLKPLYPALELQLQEDQTERLLERLHQRRLDVILMAFPYETPGITQKILYKENFVMAAPKAAPNANSLAQPLHIDALNSDQLLLLEDGHCLRDHALAACKIQPPRQRRAFSATSLPTLIQMVGYGYGQTLLPEMAARPGNLPANIEIIEFASPKPAREIGLAWLSGSPKARDYKLLGAAIAKLQKP